MKDAFPQRLADTTLKTNVLAWTKLDETYGIHAKGVMCEKIPSDMFCPNCASGNAAGQGYCRSCGLKLDAIAQAVADSLPTENNAALQRRRQLVETLGKGALTIAGVIALMSFIFAAALYKLIVFGPEVLFIASAIALAVFVMLGVGLIGYSRFLLMGGSAEESMTPGVGLPDPRTTGKLLQDRPFEPVPSVIENTTDLLPVRDRSDHD